VSRKTKKSRKDRKRSAKARRRLSGSTLDQHDRNDKTLTPPFRSLLPDPSSTKSWRDYRLPEMLWAALIISHLPRPEALDVFQQVAKFIGQIQDTDSAGSVTLSGLARLSPHLLQGFLDTVAATENLREVLRPLLLFRELPARDYWQQTLGQTPSIMNGWAKLQLAVAKTLDHQSQESTDCRWVRLLCAIAAERLIVTKESAVMYVRYPQSGDVAMVQASVRAAEVALDVILQDIDEEWPSQFWACQLSPDMGPVVFGQDGPLAEVTHW